MQKHITILFTLLDDIKNGDKRAYYVRDIRNLCSSSRDKINKYQWNTFQCLISYAYQHVPYYKELFKNVGLIPELIRSPADLIDIPILEKKDIREHRANMVNPDIPAVQLVQAGTGGTTESSIQIYLDKECLWKRRAATRVFSKWYGYIPGMRMAYLWGANQDFSKDTKSLKNDIRQLLLGRNLFLPTVFLNDERMWTYFHTLKDFRPQILQAYPTPLYMFACFLEKNKLDLCIPNINVAAEHLYEYQREKINSVFKTKIFNWYGARELGHIATECHIHKGLHINAHGVYMEVLKDGKPVYDQMGEIVITDLLNQAMPLIRYKIGDIGRISNRMCDCGSNLPLLEELGGRYTETFKKRDGTIIPGVSLVGLITTQVVKDHLGIKKLQIIQKDFEHLQLNIVKGNKYNEGELEKLEEQLSQFMREQLTFDVHFVDDIPQEKSGKVLFCKSEIAMPPSG